MCVTPGISARVYHSSYLRYLMQRWVYQHDDAKVKPFGLDASVRLPRPLIPLFMPRRVTPPSICRCGDCIDTRQHATVQPFSVSSRVAVSATRSHHCSACRTRDSKRAADASKGRNPPVLDH